MYDENGNLVASIENNEVTYREYGIAVAAADDAKVIGLLNPEKYDIKITAMMPCSGRRKMVLPPARAPQSLHLRIPAPVVRS